MLLLAAVAVALGVSVVTEEGLKELQQLATSWTPAIHDRFRNMTVDEFRARLIPVENLRSLRTETHVSQLNLGKTKELPKDYDPRVERAHCLPEVADQASCGSCWAFSAVATFADRRCAYGLDSKPVHYSEQYVVSCDFGDGACNGGWLSNVWKFLTKTGVPKLDCLKYSSGMTGDRGSCITHCTDGGPVELYQASHVINYGMDLDRMMEALVYDGPLQVAFIVYSDFSYYSSGVYQHVNGMIEGGHAVEMVGYGIDESGLKYWIIRNSWGPDWGEGGYFRIIRGVNECGIEEQAYGPFFEK